MRPHVLISVLALALVAPTGAGARTFSRTYDTGTSWDDLRWAGPLPGGGLAIGGSTDVVPGRFGDALVVHLDDIGSPLWAKAYGTAEREGASGAAPTSDGGMLLCGATTFAFDDRPGFLARTNRDGTLAWSRSLVAPTGTQVITAFATMELADLRVAVAGNYSEFDFPPRPAFVMVFEADGTPRWQTFFGSGELEQPQAIAQAQDGTILVAGLTAQAAGAGDDDAWVAKLGLDGTLLWARRFGGSGADELTSIVVTTDGGAIAAGTTQSFTSSGRAPFVVKLAADGTIAWHRVFGDAEWGDAYGVAERPDGYVVVGRIALPGAPTIDLWLCKLDKDGNPSWQRLFDSGSGDWGIGVAKAADGSGFVVSGMAGWGFPEQDHWLIQTDRDGLLSCPQETDAALAATSPALVEAPSAATVQPIVFTFPDAQFTEADVTVAEHVACDACAAAGDVPPAEPSAPRARWQPLRVARVPAPQVRVELPDRASALDLYVDRIGSWYAPSAATGTACAVTAWTDDGDGTVTIDTDIPAGSWVVVSASNACGESSAGRDSFGVERKSVGTWEACPLGP